MTNISSTMRTAVESGRVPGLVALAATRDRSLFQGAFGRRSQGDPATMTEDTVFTLASMTKAVTSVAAMQLAEEGRIGLDDPLGALLPEMRDPQVLEGFDSAGRPLLR